jgi:hypothetical protein
LRPGLLRFIGPLNPSNDREPLIQCEQLGHHSISITVNIYGHRIRSRNRDAVNQLSNQVSASHLEDSEIPQNIAFSYGGTRILTGLANTLTRDKRLRDSDFSKISTQHTPFLCYSI